MAVKIDNVIVRFVICAWYVGVSLPVYRLLLYHPTNIHVLTALPYLSISRNLINL